MTIGSKKRVAIIGSGIAGMSAAIRLAAKGYEITVYESSSVPGGKLHEFYLGKYRFDAGPSLFTLPQLVVDLLKIAGIEESSFPYIQLEKGCHYFYEDGVSLIAYQNKQKFAEEIKKKLRIDPKPVLSYMDRAKSNYEATAPLFIESSLHKLSTYFSRKTLKGFMSLPQLHMLSTMNARNVKELKEPHLVQYFNRFATYNGSSPYKAPATLNMIPHLEHGIGTFFPKNGMNQISESLHKAAEKLGVLFHFNATVNEILVEKNTAKGLIVNGEKHQFDWIVSNMDIYPTYKKLMPKQPAPENLLIQEKSSSAIIFYWGIKKSFEQLDLHNIFFSSNYEEEFASIFEYKEIYSDPTIYVNISSKYRTEDAPNNCENWFVMVNVPPNTGQDWEQNISIARAAIIKKLSRMLGENIEEFIEVESILDPRQIEAKTSSFGGSLYGNASNNIFSAFLRHPNFSKQIPNLFFCGGSVHPGGGIPLCLNSGKLAAEMIVAKND
jgi:phytoene desaturase